MSISSLFSDFDAQAIVHDINKEGGTSIANFLNLNVRLALLEELKYLELMKSPETFGRYNVKQMFSSVDSFDDNSLFVQVKNELEQFLMGKFQICNPYPLKEKLQFSETVVQRYPPGQIGISPHRDGKSFINIVAVIVLEGQGRFCFCDDRDGKNTRPVCNAPGALVLMRAIGFLDADTQPFHFVDQIAEQRTTYALRQKASK